MKNRTPNELAQLFKALGDPTRLTIFGMLSKNPERRLCVCAIAKHLRITQSAVSQHLKVLKNAGLVTPNRDGFRVHYMVNIGRVNSLQRELEFMSAVPLKKNGA